jgi:hypothetical protein
VAAISAAERQHRDQLYTPIAVEDAGGRAEYVRCQKAIAERAAVLRQALLARCRALLDAAAQGRP